MRPRRTRSSHDESGGCLCDGTCTGRCTGPCKGGCSRDCVLDGATICDDLCVGACDGVAAEPERHVEALLPEPCALEPACAGACRILTQLRRPPLQAEPAIAARIACEAACGADPTCLANEAASRCPGDTSDDPSALLCRADATPTSCGVVADWCVDKCVVMGRAATQCAGSSATASPEPDRAGQRGIRLLGAVVEALARLRAVRGAPRDAIEGGIERRAGQCGALTVRRLEVAGANAALAEGIAPQLEAALTG